MSRRNIIVVILAAITIFNVAAILKLFYYKNLPREEEVATDAKSSIKLPRGQYALWFREQLQLNNQQFEVFRSANQKYHREGATILDDLQQTRTAIIVELGREQPDEGELKYLSERIGELHVQLKELTINYYLTMKEVCNASQREKLYQIFKAMADPEGNATIPEGGFRRSDAGLDQ